MKTKVLAGLVLSTLARPTKSFLPAVPHIPLAGAALTHSLRPYTSTLPSWGSNRGGAKTDRGDISLFRPFWNSGPDFFNMFDDFDDFWPLATGNTNRGITSSAGNNAVVMNRMGKMAMDFKETKDSYEVIVDLPGIEDKDIHIKLKNNQLTISAHRESQKKEDNANYHRVERYSGHITRTITLPENADLNTIAAENKNGVLHVTVKKNQEEITNERKIEIKNSSSNQQAQAIPAASSNAAAQSQKA